MLYRKFPEAPREALPDVNALPEWRRIRGSQQPCFCSGLWALIHPFTKKSLQTVQIGLKAWQVEIAGQIILDGLG